MAPGRQDLLGYWGYRRTGLRDRLDCTVGPGFWDIRAHAPITADLSPAWLTRSLPQGSDAMRPDTRSACALATGAISLVSSVFRLDGHWLTPRQPFGGLRSRP